MPRKKCRYGFSCASMLMQPALTAEDCPNAEVCGLLTELTEEEEVELIRVREERSRRLEEQNRLIEERLQLTNRQAAVLMLRSRGLPQTPESLGLVELVESLAQKLEEVRSQLGQFEREDVYVAPEGVEIHEYSVKRPRGTYFYNKLLAQSPIFEPAERQQKVRVIHLSKSEDARSIEGALGVQRRNQLTQARTQLRNAEGALTQVLALLSEPVGDEAEPETEEVIVLANECENQLERASDVRHVGSCNLLQ